jgi:hypothetical protein
MISDIRVYYGDGDTAGNGNPTDGSSFHMDVYITQQCPFVQANKSYGSIKENTNQANGLNYITIPLKIKNYVTAVPTTSLKYILLTQIDGDINAPVICSNNSQYSILPGSSSGLKVIVLKYNNVSALDGGDNLVLQGDTSTTGFTIASVSNSSSVISCNNVGTGQTKLAVTNGMELKTNEFRINRVADKTPNLVEPMVGPTGSRRLDDG